MAEFQLPFVIAPDDMKPEHVRFIQEMMRYAAQQAQTVKEDILRDPRFSNERVANGLRAMHGVVNLDKAARPNPNDILYSPDGIHAVWGSFGAPSPTDPGTGPEGGLVDGDYGDITVHSGGSGMSINAGVVDYAKMASVVGSIMVGRTGLGFGSLGSISRVTNRAVWLPTLSWVNSSTVPATYNIFGTDPDQYGAWSMDSLGDYTIISDFLVPDAWASGVITASVLWTTTGAVANNWVPYLERLERVDGDSMVANATTITGAATSTNFAADILKITTVGTWTPTAAQRYTRLAIRRNALTDANDNSTAVVNIVGLRLTYEPLY